MNRHLTVIRAERDLSVLGAYALAALLSGLLWWGLVALVLRAVGR